jgi:hypothetical protein
MLQKALKTATVVATALLVACGGNDAPESTSGQPAAEQPNQPVVEQPNQPVVEQPNQPVVEQPNQPVVEQPNQPVVEQPTLLEQYEALLAQANVAEAEAKAKAKLDCTSSEQCSTLTFRSPLAPCFFSTFLEYSTADSANATEVEAAANRYETAAQAAESIAPPSNLSGSCFTNVDMRPLACIDNRCQRGFVF